MNGWIGDLFIAFSTVRPIVNEDGLEVWHSLPNPKLDPLFVATVEATEEVHPFKLAFFILFFSLKVQNFINLQTITTTVIRQSSMH